MKKLCSVILVVVILLALSVFSVVAEDDVLAETIGTNELYSELPQDVQDSLSAFGVTRVDYTQLNNITFEDIINYIRLAIEEQGSAPLKIMVSLIGIMLLYSFLYGVKSSAKLTNMEQVLSVCVTLCITCVVVIPVTDMIISSVNVINTAADFILAYTPVMLLIMVSNGQPISGASYYSLMIFAGQGVAQVSSNIIAPFLKMYLGLSITSAISPSVNLRGFVELIGKITKWLLGFIMTLFTALLTFKQLITTAMDNVSTRAVRFTLTSLVPIVGSALSDAYKTVQSSVGLLKSGVGVFVILAIAILFVPTVIKCLFWLVSLGVCKSVAEVLNLKEPIEVMSSVNVVLTTLFGIILCIMSLFIILTALVLLLGGGGA